MTTGHISFHSLQRGYGFIQPDDGGAPVFFHLTACRQLFEHYTNRRRVEYDASATLDGRARATRVELLVE